MTPQLPESYPDCLDFLYARNQFSIKLGLETINALLDRLGRPDFGMRFLHVAGTNGKGSVCANLAALLRATGHRRVGLYTSPHLVSFRERILVDGEPVAKDWIVAWLRRAMPLVLELNATYFECVTAMALDYFKDRRCEISVLETGLGGRLDATNAVRPELTVITSISLDHTSILGHSVEEIWREKIAILKPGVPMVVREDRPHLLRELEAKARAAGSPVFTLRDFPWARVPANPSRGSATTPEGDRLRFQGRFAAYAFPASLRREEHQIENLALSLLAMETFLGKPLPAPAGLTEALSGARVTGRTQLLEAKGKLPVLLDGAHNPGGMEALARYLRRDFPGRRITALFAVMRDKDFLEVYRSITSFASEVLYVPLEKWYPRALPYPELVAATAVTPGAAPEAGTAPGAGASTALRELPLDFPAAPALDDLLIPRAGGPELLVVCGSLYLLGKIIPALVPHYPALEPFRKYQNEG